MVNFSSEFHNNYINVPKNSLSLDDYLFIEKANTILGKTRTFLLPYIYEYHQKHPSHTIVDITQNFRKLINDLKNNM